jgi:hypothetical protein
MSPHNRSARRMKLLLFATIILLGAAESQMPRFRPPAVPLVTVDPYFSIWSFADTLYADWPRHWTGKTHGLNSMVRVDGMVYRLMGRSPGTSPGMNQTSVSVTPTRTRYVFSGAGVEVHLEFLTPMLVQDVEWLSKPITYVRWEVVATDGKEHRVAIYVDASGEPAVNTPDQKVVWGRFSLDSLEVLRIGSQEQPVLGRSGDDLRIDWGYLYLAARKVPGSSFAATGHEKARRTFVDRGLLPLADDLNCPRAVEDDWPVLAHAYDFGSIGTAARSHSIILAYDDLYSIQYFQRNLRPYWRRNGAGAEDLLHEASGQYASVEKRCRSFDEEFAHDASLAGGERYALLAALAYRQCLAANKIVADLDGTMLMFPKENFSNGCIGTVDVIYPASPLFLLLNPALLKAQLAPLLDYAQLPRWKFPFAPHDLGTYPFANGQVYGGGEKNEENQMPVEESGNMILMVAGVAVAERDAAFAQKYWPVLSRWAEYLKEKGFDPENQLCTDDFAGHLAHNVNLSAKAILALGAYAKLCDMTGKKTDASGYRKLAEGYVRQWQAQADDGDHYRLAFDRPGTWSQKYNLIWDGILDLNLFPPDVRRREIQYYLSRQNVFGLPLDNRKDYTKLDWILWSATLADSRKDFEALLLPVVRFADETPSRVPLTDWYWTSTGQQVGFQARSVVGGVLMKMLADRPLARKWQERLSGKGR